jgi:SAM-dependent methyltransferase
MQMQNQRDLDFRRSADIFLGDKQIKIPFYSPQIDKESSVPLLLDRRLNTEGIGGICFNLPDFNDMRRQLNTYSGPLRKNFGKDIIFSDPCSEVLWYRQPMSREKTRQLDIAPALNEMIDEVPGYKNHDKLWAKFVSGNGMAAKLAEGNIEMQSRTSDVCFPITPVLHSDSPREVIDIAFKVNKQTMALAESFNMATKGAYFNIHGNMFEPDSSSFSYFASRLYEMIKDTDEMMIFIKLQNSEHIAQKLERLNSFREFMNGIYRAKHMNGRDGKPKRILVHVGGVRSLGTISLYAGADSFGELINGGTMIEMSFRPNMPRPKNWQFGRYYHPIEMTDVSYDTITEFVRRHGVLPCTGQICQEIKEGFINVDIENDPDVKHDLNSYPWPWKNNEIDYIHMRQVLEHLQNPLMAIMECYRILKKGGIVYIQVPYGHTASRQPFHIHDFFPEWFRNIEIRHSKAMDAWRDKMNFKLKSLKILRGKHAKWRKYEIMVELIKK